MIEPEAGAGASEASVKISRRKMLGMLGLAAGAVVASSSLLPGVAAAAGDFRTVKDHGAVGDGATDDTAAFQAAIDYAFANKIGAVLVPPDGRYVIDGNLTIKEGVTLYSTHTMPEFSFYDINLKGGSLLLHASATIAMAAASSIAGLYIIRKGLVYPVQGATELAKYAGTAISVQNGAHGATIEDCMILGFHKAIVTDTNGDKQRLRVRRVNIDCNNGIEHGRSHDISTFDQVHCFPFGTLGGPAQPDAMHQRFGTAFKLWVFGDWHKLTGCFSFGYNRGFVISDCNEIVLFNCGADYTPTLGGATPIGYEILGTSQQLNMVNCNAVGNTIGVSVATSGANTTMLIEGCSIFRSTIGIQINSGEGATIANNRIRDCTDKGISITGGAQPYYLYGNTFKACPTAIHQVSAATPAFQRGNTAISGVTTLHNNPYVVTLTAASTVTLPAGDYSAIVLNGSGTVTTLGSPKDFSGRTITVICGGSITFPAGAKMRINGTYSTAAEGTLTLASNGDAWFEVCRVVR